MEEEPIEVGRFLFSIEMLKYSNGEVDYKTTVFNGSVLADIIIMQMRAFLDNLEKDYFDDFNSNVSVFKKE